MFAPFEDHSAEPAVRGFLHVPAAANAGGDAIVLAHGAGANCQAKLLVAVADALAASGFTVLRFDLPFRLARPFGPPRPGSAERDRLGIRRAASLLKDRDSLRVFIGGHSYGGRQGSMLLADDPFVADGLLLLSYPLHPPKKPADLRTKHFPQLTKKVLFVHGTLDPFGSIDEMQSALKLISAPHALLPIDGGAHDLLPKKSPIDVPLLIADEFLAFVERA